MMSSCAKNKADIGIYSILRQIKESDFIKHFQVEGIPQSKIYFTISCFKCGLLCNDKPRKGRPAKLDKKQQLKLKNFAEN